MTEEERQSIIDEIKEQLLADMVDITKLPKGDATDGASLPVLQHSELVIQELNNFIGVYDIDVERQSADSDIVNIYLKNAAGVVIKTIVTNAATLEQVNTKVAKINESLTLISSSLSAKQDTLKSGVNIKTINGTSLLGSGDVVVSGDASGSVDEGRLVWSSEDSPSTLMDIAYLNGNGNKIAGIPPSLVTIEYSADNGATWVDSGISDANKTRLTNHRINGNTNLRPNGSTTLDINYQTRITIDLIEDNATNAWVGCFEFRKIILKCSGIQRNDTHTLTIEMQKYGSTTWDIIKTSRFWGSPGFFSIPTPKRTVGYPSSSYYRKVRLTWQPGDVYTNVAGINGVYFMSDNTVGVGGGKEPSQYAITGTPYSIDYDQNTIFPNAIKGKKLITDGGKSTQVVKGDGSLEEESALAVASAIDAEHAIEADYAGVADKADKLTTGRTIGITGGAVGTDTNFDGSGNIKIPVTSIDDSYITWTTSNRKAYGSVTDNLMKNGQQNSFAFFPPDAVTVEYTNDSGATWLDYGLTDEQKTRFLTPLVGNQTLKVGKDGADLADTAQLRITLDFVKANMQLELRKIMLQTQYYSNTTNGSVRIKILSELYANYNTDTWDEFIDVDVRTPGWMSLPVTNRTDATWGYKGSGTSYPAKLRVVFYRTGTPLYNTYLLSMVGLSNFISRGNDIAKYCWPCTMDVNKNATFPANVTATKHITQGGTNQQVLLGDGTLITFDELKAKLGLI